MCKLSLGCNCPKARLLNLLHSICACMMTPTLDNGAEALELPCSRPRDVPHSVTITINRSMMNDADDTFPLLRSVVSNCEFGRVISMSILGRLTHPLTVRMLRYTPQDSPVPPANRLNESTVQCRDAEEVMFADSWRLVAACSSALVVLRPSSLQPCALHLLSPADLPQPAPRGPAAPPSGDLATGTVLPRSSLQPSHRACAFTAGAAAVAPILSGSHGQPPSSYALPEALVKQTSFNYVIICRYRFYELSKRYRCLCCCGSVQCWLARAALGEM